MCDNCQSNYENVSNEINYNLGPYSSIEPALEQSNLTWRYYLFNSQFIRNVEVNPPNPSIQSIDDNS